MKGINRKSATCRLCKKQAKQKHSILPKSHAVHKIALRRGNVVLEDNSYTVLNESLFALKLIMGSNSKLRLNGFAICFYDGIKTKYNTLIIP